MNQKKTLFFGLIVLIIVVLDQISKNIVQSLRQGESIELIPGFLNIGNYFNTGASFGMLGNQTWFLILFSIVIIGLIIYYYNKIPKEYNVLTALILGGTIGNLIDRLFLGFVVDFIDLSFWPAFNIADIAVTLGAILIIVFMIKNKHDKTIHIRSKTRRKRKVLKQY